MPDTLSEHIACFTWRMIQDGSAFNFKCMSLLSITRKTKSRKNIKYQTDSKTSSSRAPKTSSRIGKPWWNQLSRVPNWLRDPGRKPLLTDELLFPLQALLNLEENNSYLCWKCFTLSCLKGCHFKYLSGLLFSFLLVTELDVQAELGMCFRRCLKEIQASLRWGGVGNSQKLKQNIKIYQNDTYFFSPEISLGCDLPENLESLGSVATNIWTAFYFD